MFELIKIDNNLNYQQFYNMLCSYGFLPPIIQPTRVTDHHYLNIFSNNLIDETSGDILLTVCEHFSQVVSIRGRKWTKKLKHLSTRFQNTTFQIQQFREVVIQNWNTELGNL